jgi:hypothetical protein
MTLHPSTCRLAPPAVALREMILGYVVSQTVGTVARLCIPDHLASGPLHEAELARRTGADADALGRLLQAAASVGLVDVDADGDVELTPTGELLRTGRMALLEASAV